MTTFAMHNDERIMGDTRAAAIFKGRCAWGPQQGFWVAEWVAPLPRQMVAGDIGLEEEEE